ncbi:MAG: hypothetical protein NUV86_08180 [Candidatus Scalindua sp.]|nr:hypothetical protein [Candidatus Scalindua sp.]
MGLDLSQEAIEDLKQAKIDRDNSNKDAYVDHIGPRGDVYK